MSGGMRLCGVLLLGSFSQIGSREKGRQSARPDSDQNVLAPSPNHLMISCSGCRQSFIDWMACRLASALCRFAQARRCRSPQWPRPSPTKSSRPRRFSTVGTSAFPYSAKNASASRCSRLRRFVMVANISKGTGFGRRDALDRCWVCAETTPPVIVASAISQLAEAVGKLVLCEINHFLRAVRLMLQPAMTGVVVARRQVRNDAVHSVGGTIRRSSSARSRTASSPTFASKAVSTSLSSFSGVYREGRPLRSPCGLGFAVGVCHGETVLSPVAAVARTECFHF